MILKIPNPRYSRSQPAGLLRLSFSLKGGKMRAIASILKFITVLMIMCAMSTACVGVDLKTSSISQNELKSPHKITIIPYKASPILIKLTRLEHEASGVFGFIGRLAYIASTEAARGKIAEHFNNSAASWNPSLALAEECLAILQNKSKTSTINVSIGNLGTLPGSEALHKQEPRIFTEIYDADWSIDWRKVWYEFRDTNNSLIKYKKENPIIQSDWSLEVFSYGIGLNKNEIAFSLYMKLMNTSTNEKIAAQWAGENYSIPAMPDSFDQFNQTWRAFSQKECTKALSDMGLIPK
jgi:hypothetical protein